MRTALLAGFLATIWSVHGAIYDQPSLLPSDEYDYIIIGGGNAGNVVANRLSEDPNVSVLILEAGGSDEAIEDTQVPLLGPSLLSKSECDWGYETEPMRNLNNRTIRYGRGFILGGTSTTNFMVYNRGPRDDFDHYAKIAGTSEWSWNNIFRNFAPKNERFVAPNDGHIITGQYKPSVHFETGAVDISLPGYPWPLDGRVMNLTQEFPDEFPYNIDVNDGEPLGIGWNQASVGYGLRSSSATSYLGRQYIIRPNLSVLLHARVTKIVKTGILGGLPLFGAVEFARNASSSRTLVKARKEVILSAGAFNTPQILMLSGIGNKVELAKFGIQAILNLPSVGQNATDHSMLANVLKVNTTETFEQYYASNSSRAQWEKTHKGPLSYTIANHIGFLRLPNDDPVLKQHGDPSTGPTSPHYELLFVPGFISLTQKRPTSGTYNTIFTVVTSPSSVGTVKLRSANPFDSPLINPNYLATETDWQIMITSVRTVLKIARSKSWEGYFNGYFGGLADDMTDKQIKDYASENSAGLWHFSGSAAMSAKGAKYGVVDPDFRVKGTAGLRVVDASVFPSVPQAHPMGPIYLISELASHMIKSQANSGKQHYQVTGQVPIMD